MKITDLTAAERRIWRAFPRGERVKFRDTDERAVRAEVIQSLLLGNVSEDGKIAALRLEGAHISGRLNLAYAIIDQPISLRACRFEYPPTFYGAQVRQLNLSRSYLPELDAPTIRVAGVLRITGCRIPGPVKLGGAKISGALFADRANLGDEHSSDQGQNAVLQLNHATIGDDLSAEGLVTHGQVRLVGATISGAVNFEKASLSNPGHTALKAENLTVGSNLVAKSIQVDGRVNLRGSKIPGKLDLDYARLSNPGGVAFRASSCTVGELWLREAMPIVGEVNLRRSQFSLISVAPEIWPDRVKLNGLSYGAIIPPLPASRRLELLEREHDYVPHAYEQLTAAYRRIGDDAAARAVQLAKQRRHRKTLSWYAKVWGYMQDATVGYGFRPTRAMAWLLALMLFGTVVYGFHHPSPVEPVKGPDFNSAVYTLDLLLPIIDFGQEKAFTPHGPYQWLAYLLIAAGWILATTVVAGITRIVSRQ
ncbi:hypothetical protein NE236_36940 [Actinoallomurus purpureus]|uniref:hypothetical protein n=1 Tax=Actinoallomurus purpureus TaxID=478114 RepID=UPI002093EC74|nr:hypothetical protein [Actinoallomurus purpureus]MCO6010560.1 hypothetical protein [Actinoallomurus purpureus]